MHMSTAQYALPTFIKTEHLQQLMCYIILAIEGRISSWPRLLYMHCRLNIVIQFLER